MCPECGREHVQDGASDLYCVCGDGQVALSSYEWEDIHYVRLEDVIEKAEEIREDDVVDPRAEMKQFILKMRDKDSLTKGENQ